MSAKTKTFSDKQLQRLPDSGYVVEIDTFSNRIDSVVCIMNGQVKYARGADYNWPWTTLMWSCSPTRKQVAAGNRGLYSRLEHYATHADLLAAHPGHF